MYSTSLPALSDFLLCVSLVLTHVVTAGTLFISTGDKYTGDWKDGKRHGNGTYFYRQVHTHSLTHTTRGRESTVKSSHGRCAVDLKPNTHSLSALYVSHLPDFFWCDVFCSDGDKFDGEWRNDERHGKGAMVYCNGDSGVQEKYEGEWVEGRMHGR